MSFVHDKPVSSPASKATPAPTKAPLAAAPPAQAKSAPASSPTAKTPTDTKNIQAQAGKAIATVSLSPKAAPLNILGLKQGDRLSVDGTLNADGGATVKTLNENQFELQAQIHIPGIAQGIADDEFKLVNGKVNLSIKLTREGDQYRYELKDTASGKNKGSGSSELKVTNGTKTVSSLFSSERVKTQTLQIKTDQGNLTIQLQQNSKGAVSGSVTIPGLPGIVSTFDLEKL